MIIIKINKLSAGILAGFCLLFITADLNSQPSVNNLKIDASRNYGVMDGFGVNVNTAWWYNGKYEDASIVQPALDLLIDSLGAVIFRAVIEEIDWEEVNDDNNPAHINQDFFNKVFTNPRFTGVWNTLRYLNKKGITDNLMISFMGAPPAAPPMMPHDAARSWMGGTDNTIAPGMEEEMAETIAALLYYMRNTAGIEFKLVSPMNETDIQSRVVNNDHPEGVVEGPNIPDPVQYVTIIRALARKLDALGMEDVRFVLPDGGYGDKLFGGCLGEILKDKYLTEKMAHWGVHEYGDESVHYTKLIDRNDNPLKFFWVTETASNMLPQLDDGGSAFIFWDGFDCVYQHGRRNGYGDVPPNDWVFWEGEKGKPLIAFDPGSGKWTPRKQFYEQYQMMKYIKPGAVRIGISGQDSSLTVSAFRNIDGSLVIAGKNNKEKQVELKCEVSEMPGLKSMKLIYTNDGVSAGQNKVRFRKNVFSTVVPAESIFTIVGAAQ